MSVQKKILLHVCTILIFFNLFDLANAAPIPPDTDGDGLPDSIELWLLNKNPAILDDASNPVSVTVANLYLDGDSDGIPNIIEDNLTHTSKTVDDTQVCTAGGISGVDTTGQWDVRISNDLVQPINFLIDKLSGISVCHTGTSLTVYDPALGYADTTSFSVSPNNLIATWTGPGTSVSIDAIYSPTGGAFLGPRLEGTATIDGSILSFRADLRHILDGTEFNALNGIVGEQVRINDASHIALDYGFNPFSDGDQVFINNDKVTFTAYNSNGNVITGYYVPSVGVILNKNVYIESGNFDNDGFFDDQKLNVDEVMVLVIEPPVSGVGGMLRGELDFVANIDLDYLTFPGIDSQEETFSDLYAKYQTVNGVGITWNTPVGTMTNISLLNVPTGVDTVTLTGPAGSGYDTGVDVIGGSSSKTMADITVRSRLPGFTDGEKVGLAGDGNRLNITSFTTVTASVNGTYTFTFNGGPGGINPSPVNVSYTLPGLSLPRVDEANVVLDGDTFSPLLLNRTINPLVSHVMTWPHIDTGSISAAVYEIQIASMTDPDSSQLLMYLNAATACGGGVCAAVFEPKTFLPNSEYRINIRPRAGSSGAASRNRSVTNDFYFNTSGIDCVSDSVTGNVIASAPCGHYNKIITRQSPGEPDVTLDYMLHAPVGASKGMVILFAGGNGDTQITGNAATGDVASANNNFLVRSAQLFAEHGYLTVTLDRPSDTNGMGAGAFDSYRTSMRAAVDIAHVIALENTSDLDVFLVGTSTGAISVVSNYLLGTGIGIPSAVTSGVGSRLYVGHLSLPPEDVTVPVHYLTHQYDGCAVSNPADAPAVYARFTGLDPLYSSAGAVNEMPTALTGGFEMNPDPCKATTRHGFLGTENTAITSITTWIDGIMTSLGGTYVGNKRPITSGLIRDTYYNVELKLDLHSLSTDADGDILDFDIPHMTSSLGAGLSISGSIVTYTPTGETNVTDTFVYTVADGKGGVNNNVVTLNVNGASALMDTDNDTIVDAVDNCTLVPNVKQRDTDGDKFGNFCDPDLNNDGVINFIDQGLMKSVFFTADPDADLNGDGVVNFGDVGILKSRFFGLPGPSGLVP